MRQCQKIQWEAADEFNRRQHVYQVKLVSSIRRDYESWVQLESSHRHLAMLAGI
jgi:hypothetical protein